MADKPTEPGYYWCRWVHLHPHGDQEFITVAEIERQRGELVAYFIGNESTHEMHLIDDIEWGERLTAPWLKGELLKGNGEDG